MTVECTVLHSLQISAIFEYGSILKVKVEFREVAIADRPAGQFSFACECEVAGKRYPQGIGNTKKKAKTAAARIAMDTILEQGLDIAGEQSYLFSVLNSLLFYRTMLCMVYAVVMCLFALLSVCHKPVLYQNG